MNGILLIDKPADWTSHDVVAKVRRVLSQTAGQKVKVGHTGTLDPAATGLLILVIGKHTKRAAEFSKLDKTYKAELTLGQVSSTADSEGQLSVKSTKQPSQAEVMKTLEQFVGQFEQIPPAFSAIKVAGQRAYRLARAGKSVELKPRQVQIYSISDIEYKYPNLNFTVSVSSGTYIRSLAQDIGKALGTGAYLSKLCRTEVGDYNLSRASHIDKIKISDIISS